MARVATHYGHCQICGSQQKLPGSVLSLHGYTVQWGFFSGVCSGSNHKPFEQSKDLIEGVIKSTTESADRLQAQINELTKFATTPATWVNYKVKATRKGESDYHRWAQGEVIEGEYDLSRGTRFFVMVENSTIKAPVGSYGSNTVLEAATAGNRSYAQMLDSRMHQMRDYVQWQKERIKNWKPADLKEIPASDLGSAKAIPKVHFEAAKYGYKHTGYCAGSAIGAQRMARAITTTEREKVTCAACLKALKDADEAPARRAAEKEKERLRQIKSLERDIKEYSKWIKQGNEDATLVLHWTELLSRATADLEKKKAEQ